MQLTPQILTELQNRLKIGNRRGVHLNAVPGNSKYKLDLKRFSLLDEGLPEKFIEALLSKQQLSFKINQRNIKTDMNLLKMEEHKELVKLTRTFDNLIFQTEAIESEKGVNTFAFGFPILVRRDLKDNKLTLAPIFIWSLNVKNLKDKTWQITRNEDDPVYLNEVLINHLIADSNIEIEKVNNDNLEDGFLSKDRLIEICSGIIKTINGHVTTDIQNVLTKKISFVSAIGTKKFYEDLPISSNNALIEFGGLFSIFEVQKQNIIGDYGNLIDLDGLNIGVDDIENFDFQSISSVETDPSQQSILNSLKSSSHIVIQGPPGTGKSQTLAAILINALENKKKTLVVCEKRTALDVLHQILLEKGLNYHSVLIKDIIHDRRKVVDSVRDRLSHQRPSRSSLYGAQYSLNQLIRKAQNLIQSINKKHKKLDQNILGNKNWTDIVGALIRERKTLTEEESLKIEKSLFKFNEDEFNELLEILKDGQKLYEKYRNYELKSWIHPKNIQGNNPYEIQEKLNGVFDEYKKTLDKLKDIYKDCRLEYLALRKNEFHDVCSTIEELFSRILDKEKEFQEVLSKSKAEYTQNRQHEFDQQYVLISDKLNTIKSIFERHSDYSELTNPIRIKSTLFKILTKVSKKKMQVLKDHDLLVITCNELETFLRNSKDFKATNFQTSIGLSIDEYKRISVAVEKSYSNSKAVISSEFSALEFEEILERKIGGLEFYNKYKSVSNKKNTTFEITRGLIVGQFEKLNEEMRILINSLHSTISACRDIKMQWEFNDCFKTTVNEFPKIKEYLVKVNETFEQVVNAEFDNTNWFSVKTFSKNIPPSISILKNKSEDLHFKIKTDYWTKVSLDGSSFESLVETIEGLFQTKNDFFKDPEEPFLVEFDWYVFYNKLSFNQKKLLDVLKPRQDWVKCFAVFYLDTLLLKNAHIDIPKNDDEHKEYLSISKGLQSAQLSFVTEYWYNEQIKASQNFKITNGDLSVENLFNKRKSTRHSRLSLRQIVKYDLDLFTTFFPIILTTPDVASNLFQGINGYFDIVMFDEASQLRIEDNLPALFKGKQIVIAGDEHQMPPSNYFNKIFDGSIEDDAEVEDEDVVVLDKSNIVLSCESLLEFGIELNFKKQYLDFHYRSKHPYLIDFSNYAFYNQRLKPLPNTSNYFPIKFVNVNGTYQDHTNNEEAETILSIIENNINRKPNGEYPTLGIATFNVAQRDHIKSKIVEAINSSQNEKLISKLIELDQKGMFIKNLENIQGDERDVIIISTTYGYTIDNNFAQRFGPINFEKGYKLLNVLITRAKYKIYVCSSIPEKLYSEYKSYLVTEQSNNRKAVFYAYLAYCKAVSEGNDEARIAVLNALSENSTRHAESTILREIEHESPFEEEVYERLSKILDPVKLHTQYKVSEFRIDIVYDPQIQGYPKIAIECDGANFHSSPEAYLYDCHRQKILESHGFVFHRIWSTNWWRNPEKETDHLLNFIESIENEYEVLEDDKTLVDRILIHDVTVKSREIERSSIDDITFFDDYIDDKFKIKIGSIVTIKYLKDGKEITIEITSDSSIIKNSKRVQKISLKSPLAVSLIGREKGEKVKIPGGDLIIEILSVENRDE